MLRKLNRVAITWTAALVTVQLWSLAPALAAPARQPRKPAHPLPPVKDSATLGTIDGEADTELTIINLRFDKKPQWQALRELQDHGSFLQLILPDTIVPEPGKFVDGNSPYIPKIAVFQLTATDAGVRFFVNQDAAKTKDATTFEVLDKRIVLTVDHEALKAGLSAAKVAAAKEAQPSAHAVVEAATPKVSQAADAATNAEPGYEVATLQEALQVKSDVSAEEVIARTEVKHDIPAPAEIVKAEQAGTVEKSPFPVNGTSGAKFGPPRPDDDEAAFDALAKRAATAKEPAAAKASGFDFREKLVQVATFSGFMIVLLAVVLLLKPVLRKRAARKGGEADVIEMRTLASLPLAARQKLSLIQVGDEKILIGITPENVSFITTVGSLPTQQQRLPRQAFQGVLADGRSGMLEMQPPPKLKDIPGNDEESLRARPMRASAPASSAAKPAAASQAKLPAAARSAPGGKPTASAGAPKSAASAVSTQAGLVPPTTGTKPAAMSAGAPTRKPQANRINIAVTDDGPKDLRAAQKDDGPASQKGIEDVTQLIREKLKNLRTI